MAGTINNNIRIYMSKYRKDALKLQTKMQPKINKKIKIDFMVCNKKTAVYLTFDKYKEYNKEAKRSGISVKEYLIQKYNPEMKRERDRKAVVITYNDLKKDVMKWLGDNGFTKKFIISKQKGQNRKAQIKAIANMRYKFRDVKNLSKILGISTHKIYKAKI